MTIRKRRTIIEVSRRGADGGLIINAQTRSAVASIIAEDGTVVNAAVAAVDNALAGDPTIGILKQDVVAPTMVIQPGDGRSFGPAGTTSVYNPGGIGTGTDGDGEYWDVVATGGGIGAPSWSFGQPSTTQKGTAIARVALDAVSETGMVLRIHSFRVQLQEANRTLRIWDGTSFFLSSTGPESVFAVGQKRTIVFTWDGPKLRLWVDGALVLSTDERTNFDEYTTANLTDSAQTITGKYWGLVALDKALTPEYAESIGSMTIDDARMIGINLIKSSLQEHESSASNPHSTTAGQVGSYTKAEVDALVGPGGGSSPVLQEIVPKELVFIEQVNSVIDQYSQFGGMSPGGDILYATSGYDIHQSRDGFKTSQSIATVNWSIQAIEPTYDGEILISTSAKTTAPKNNPLMYKTRGYDPYEGTSDSVEIVHTAPNANSRVTGHWGMSSSGPIIVAGTYGSQGVASFVYLSTDSGDTWTTIFDLESDPASISGAPPHVAGRGHIHTAIYDRYRKRIWIVNGDTPMTAMYYSDDMGTSWTFVDTLGQMGGQMQFTGAIALPDGVMFGSDAKSNGLWAWRASSGSSPVTIEQVLSVSDDNVLSHVGKRAYRRWSHEGELVLFPFTVSTLYGGVYPPVLTAFTSIDNPVVMDWRWGLETALGPEQVLGPDRDGIIWTMVEGKLYRAVAPFVGSM